MVLISHWAALAASCMLLPWNSVAMPTTMNAQAVEDEDYHWVAAWTSMPQLVEPNNMPPSPFVSQSDLCFKM